MQKFKKTIYDNYVSRHNSILYGENSIAKISQHFASWKYYFGRHLPGDKNARILDIGCGDGNFVYWLHTLGYTDTSGVDVSEQQIDKGKKMGIGNLVCCDLLQYLQGNTQKYDLIIARDVIEHFDRDEVFDILKLVNENLKENGRFMIQVPNGQGLFYTSIFYGDYTHEMAYTASSVNQVILNTGFSGSRCYPVGPAPTSLSSSVRYLLWKLKEKQLKFWKAVETGSASGIFTQNLIAVIEK